MSKNDNQPVYKKPWFWVVMVAFLAIIVYVIIYLTTLNKAAEIVTGAIDAVQGNQQIPENTTYSLGDTFVVDEMEYMVTSVERNYSSGKSYQVPNTGNEYVKLNISIVNKSNNKKDYNAYYWKIEDSNGDITTYAMMGQADDALSSGELAAGGKKQGSIVFEVPLGSTIKAHFSPNIFSDKEIIINL